MALKSASVSFMFAAHGGFNQSIGDTRVTGCITQQLSNFKHEK
jgi:hypothetical protein